jgi:hypothetical protein
MSKWNPDQFIRAYSQLKTARYYQKMAERHMAANDTLGAEIWQESCKESLGYFEEACKGIEGLKDYCIGVYEIYLEVAPWHLDDESD